MTKHAIDESLVATAHALGPLIHEHAPEAERERRLSKQVVEALVKAGLTKMFLPKALGGLATDPLTCLRVVEEVSSFDSIAGWFLMVANSSTWFCARMPASTAEEVHRDPNDCVMATAFQPPVEAREVEGGYRLTGRRSFASGKGRPIGTGRSRAWCSTCAATAADPPTGRSRRWGSSSRARRSSR